MSCTVSSRYTEAGPPSFANTSENAHPPTGEGGHLEGGDFLGVERAILNTQQSLQRVLGCYRPGNRTLGTLRSKSLAFGTN